MQILAHRGYWTHPMEKNKMAAFQKAFEAGWGIETDIRDCEGRLVISHDIPDRECPSVDSLFQLYRKFGSSAPLALNVKADGLQGPLRLLLNQYCVTNYFLFDMSIPELVVNDREGLVYYTRESDIEPCCVMYENARGVWMDSFYRQDWLSKKRIQPHLQAGKEICVVSPELHGWNYDSTWKMLLDILSEGGNFLLCTDYPEQARQYFKGYID